MLTEIYNEDWGSLRTLSNDATHVPKAILALITDNEEDFNNAYWQLENHIVVQSDLYSAAAIVPKYLEEVFIKSKFKDRVSDLLFEIGAGYSSDIHLMKTCFNETKLVLKNLILNPEIKGTAYEVSLKENLSQIIELHKSHCKNNIT